MNHYPHHIGDFAKDTLGFSQGAIGAYRLLLDAYYANEEPIAAEDVYVIGRATTPAERRNVDKALAKFELRDGRYHHKRVEEELAAYQGRAGSARTNGKLGGRPHKEKPTGNRIGNPRETESDTEGITGRVTETQTHDVTQTEPTEKLASSHKPKPQTPKQAAPPVLPPGGEGSPLAALAALCVRSRVNADGARGLLHLRQFVAEGVTEAQLADAVLLARDRKPDPEVIPIGYLAPIVADLRAGRIRARPLSQEDVIAKTMAAIAAKEGANAAH